MIKFCDNFAAKHFTSSRNPSCNRHHIFTIMSSISRATQSYEYSNAIGCNKTNKFISLKCNHHHHHHHHHHHYIRHYGQYCRHGHRRDRGQSSNASSSKSPWCSYPKSYHTCNQTTSKSRSQISIDNQNQDATKRATIKNNDTAIVSAINTTMPIKFITNNMSL